MPDRGGRKPAGARLRSRLNWMILKTLAIDIGLSLTVSELIQFLWVFSSRSEGQAFHRIRRRNILSVYLDRLREQGYIRLSDLKKRREATLTPKGRRALGDLETVLREHPDALLLETGASLTSKLEALRSVRQARRWSTPEGRQAEARLQRLMKSIPGHARAEAFVSYDIPRNAPYRRRQVAGIILTAGYRRLHQSFYVGPALRLREILEALETRDVLPRLRWGTLTVFSP